MLYISLNKDSKVPMIRQLYQQIRTRILNGELTEGFKLPSTRELAAELKVSRNVVLEVYEMLGSEGFIRGSTGSGTYVAEGTCLTVCMPEDEKLAPDTKSSEFLGDDWINFRSGLPALDLFPKKKWARIFFDTCMEIPSLMLSYGYPAGSLELRKTIAAYLLRNRGMHCKPQNIIVTTGAVQALQLVARHLLAPGDDVVLEDPSNYDIHKIFKSAGGKLLPVPVDEHGIITDKLPVESAAKFIYVTPSHQYPMGGILPIQRRIELVKYARHKGCYIAEDDYDSEFRYEGAPVSSLQTLAPEKVIYIGTFSKLLFPAIRIGYLVLPEPLVKGCCLLKKHMDYQTPIMEQLTLSRFIEEKLLDRHVARVRRVYYKRQNKLIESLKQYFPGQIKIYGVSTGMHIVVEFNFKITKEMLGRIKKFKVRAYPVEIHSILKENNRNKLILGYGNLTEGQIEEGVKRMKQAFINI